MEAENGNDKSTAEEESKVASDVESAEGELVVDISKKQLKKIFHPSSKEKTHTDQEPMNKDRFYNMSHEHRGLALIFNHYDFNQNLCLDKREGTEKDKERLIKAFKKHAFDVQVFNDLTAEDIKYAIEEKIVKADHSKADCVAIAIMTHGERDDLLYARDTFYSLDDLIEMLTAEKCRSLAGKPKMFFVQACRGRRHSRGVTIATDSNPPSKQTKTFFRIPTHADFLLAYSTIPGFYSIRNEIKGSWFMRALCKKLMEDETYTKSIFLIMTEVIGHVAFKCETNPDKFKQIPTFTSRLTKDLVFGKK